MSNAKERPVPNAKPKPRRSLWRFSLKTMMIVVTLLCILLGWIAYPIEKAARQKKAVEKIKQWDEKADV